MTLRKRPHPSLSHAFIMPGHWTHGTAAGECQNVQCFSVCTLYFDMTQIVKEGEILLKNNRDLKLMDLEYVQRS